VLSHRLLLALQQTAGNRAVTSLLQRMVVRLDGTEERRDVAPTASTPAPGERRVPTPAEVTDEAALRLAARDIRRRGPHAIDGRDPLKPGQNTPVFKNEAGEPVTDDDILEGSLEQAKSEVRSARQSGFLKDLGDDEKLYLVGHGGLMPDSKADPLLPGRAATFGGYRASDLVALLIANGLSKRYKGRIFLEGCNTGSGGGSSFAAAFQSALAGHAPGATIKATRGSASVTLYGQVQVKGISGSAALQEIEAFANQLDTFHNNLTPDEDFYRLDDDAQRQREKTERDDLARQIDPFISRLRSLGGDLAPLLSRFETSRTQLDADNLPHRAARLTCWYIVYSLRGADLWSHDRGLKLQLEPRGGEAHAKERCVIS
jgi:hypothetical protein